MEHLIKTPRDKYHKDNHFKALVDMMVAHIYQCNYTPSEMREAVILASILYEEDMRMKAIEVPLMPLVVEKSLSILHEWFDPSQLKPVNIPDFPKEVIELEELKQKYLKEVSEIPEV